MLKEQISVIRKYVKRTTPVLNGVRNTAESWMSPLHPESLDEFVRLMDKKDGSVVTLGSCGYSYGSTGKRELKPEEQIYFNQQPWVDIYNQTGWIFSTVLNSLTSHRRKVLYEEIHKKRELTDDERRSRRTYKTFISGESFMTKGTSDYTRDRNRYFQLTLRLAKLLHRQHPRMQFLVDGAEGLKDYEYYQVRLAEENPEDRLWK